MGERPDDLALQDLVAEVRSTIAMLAEAEQKIAAAKVELRRHDQKARLAANVEQSMKPVVKSARIALVAVG